MDTGRLRETGTFGMGHSGLYVEDGKLIRLMGHMGYGQIAETGWDDARVMETVISERELGEEDNYATLDTPFQRANDDQLWLLHGIDRYTGYSDVLDDYTGGCEYALFYIQYDGTDELIVASEGMWTFRTIKDGKSERLGEIPSFHSSLREGGEDHSLRIYYSDMSGAEIRRVYWDGEMIDTVYLTGWEWTQGVAGEELQFYPVSDRSMLE